MTVAVSMALSTARDMELHLERAWPLSWENMAIEEVAILLIPAGILTPFQHSLRFHCLGI